MSFTSYLMSSVIEMIKVIILASIFFVWVVRYQNIVSEFQQYGIPHWLRDFVGILKLSFAFMLQSSENQLVLLGAGGIAFLMLAALYTHFRVKNSLNKTFPAIALLSLSLIVFFASNGG